MGESSQAELYSEVEFRKLIDHWRDVRNRAHEVLKGRGRPQGGDPEENKPDALEKELIAGIQELEDYFPIANDEHARLSQNARKVFERLEKLHEEAAREPLQRSKQKTEDAAKRVLELDRERSDLVDRLKELRTLVWVRQGKLGGGGLAVPPAFPGAPGGTGGWQGGPPAVPGSPPGPGDWSPFPPPLRARSWRRE